jgi:imidazolonepropionase-like amidohydrolase
MKKLLTKSAFLCFIGVFTVLLVLFYGEMFGQLTSISGTRVPRGYKPGPEGTTVITGGRIFDGTGAAVRKGTIVLERNKIKALLPPDSKDWPKDAQVIDVAGKTVMPGLIAMQEQITKAKGVIDPGPNVKTYEVLGTINAVERLQWYIESGITSIRDTGSHGHIPFRLKEWVIQNRVFGPRLFPSGQLITATGGHSTEGMWYGNFINVEVPEAILVSAEWPVDGPDAWLQIVRQQWTNGATQIAVASHFSRDEIVTAVKDAHDKGLKVTADAETFYIEWAVEAGVDVIEHLWPRTDETIKLMASQGTQAVPAITSAMRRIDREGGIFGEASRRFTVTEESLMETFRKMKVAGIKMGIGLDMGNEVIELPYTYIEELEYFVEGGYSITEALVAATKTNAEILGMADELGTIEAGKLADILVIDGKPDVDLDDLANTDLVFRDGHLLIKDGQLHIPPHDPTGATQAEYMDETGGKIPKKK